MNKFRQDNTEGFTDAQLVAMNGAFNHNLALSLADLPDGAEGANDDLIEQIKQHEAERILEAMRTVGY